MVLVTNHFIYIYSCSLILFLENHDYVSIPIFWLFENHAYDINLKTNLTTNGGFGANFLYLLNIGLDNILSLGLSLLLLIIVISYTHILCFLL
jgi:hypothetical protein